MDIAFHKVELEIPLETEEFSVFKRVFTEKRNTGYIVDKYMADLVLKELFMFLQP